MSARDLDRAVRAVDAGGALLVYPLQNRAEPPSLWRALYPRSPMRWAWDESADPRVAMVWHLRQELARSRRVVYSKWVGGRATLFSKALFGAMLGEMRAHFDPAAGLSAHARVLLELLLDDSPLPTRALRQRAELEGRENEAAFTRGMRELFERLLVVGTGEVEEGGFPSLAVGATELVFEPLYTASASPSASGKALLESTLDASPWLARPWRRLLAKLRASGADLEDP